MSAGHLEEEGVAAIASALINNQSLQSLDMAYTSSGDGGTVAIGCALATNHTLRTLKFHNVSIKTKGEVAIASALLQNQSLREVYLTGSFLDEGAFAIAKALRTNQTIYKLSLQGKHIKTDGAIAIAIALEQNQTLQTLKLIFPHECYDTITVPIARALITNQTLSELILCTTIGFDGAVAIASALKENQSLRVLDLRDTTLDDNGADVIAEALQTNTTLHTLNIKCAIIGPRGAMAFASASTKNHSLEALNLELHNWEDDPWSLEDHLNIRWAKRLIAKSLYANTMIDVSSYLPDNIIPLAIAYMSTHHQHVSKIYSLLREKPELFAY
eukprot:scaffold134043_cov57-Attheya_sp.AAC.2